jgi:hypothetical protein
MSFLSQDSQLGSPEIFEIKIPVTWRPIMFCENLWLRWGLKQSGSPFWDLPIGILYATCTQVNWSDFWLLVVRSQIDDLIPNPSFKHNLCFKYPNGSCEPILNIYVSIAFQQYKQIFNPMSFDLCNYLLKTWDSIKTPTPKVGAHLRMWGFIPSHSPTLPRAWNVTPGLHSWPAHLQAFALFVSPRPRLR